MGNFRGSSISISLLSLSHMHGYMCLQFFSVNLPSTLMQLNLPKDSFHLCLCYVHIVDLVKRTELLFPFTIVYD